MPPFGRLAALIVSANEHDVAMGFAKKLLSAAPMAEGVKLFGPADAPIAMVRGRHRVRLLAQSGKDFDLVGLCAVLAGIGGEDHGQSAGAGGYRSDELHVGLQVHGERPWTDGSMRIMSTVAAIDFE